MCDDARNKNSMPKHIAEAFERAKKSVREIMNDPAVKKMLEEYRKLHCLS